MIFNKVFFVFLYTTLITSVLSGAVQQRVYPPPPQQTEAGTAAKHYFGLFRALHDTQPIKDIVNNNTSMAWIAMAFLNIDELAAATNWYAENMPTNDTAKRVINLLDRATENYRIVANFLGGAGKHTATVRELRDMANRYEKYRDELFVTLTAGKHSARSTPQQAFLPIKTESPVPKQRITWVRTTPALTSSGPSSAAATPGVPTTTSDDDE